MTSTADQYRSNAAGFTKRVENVPPDRWEDPSPCEGWTARDVVRHTVDTSGLFLGFIGRELPHAPSVDQDPGAAWNSTRDAIQACLDDPKLARSEYDGFTGKSTFEQGVARFLSPDAVLHTWDLAHATGQDEHLDEEAAADILAMWQPMDEMMRSPGAFGEKIDPPQADDPQTKLLNFAGRRV